MQTSLSDAEPVTGIRAVGREGHILWLIVISGLFLNVTLHFGYTGRELWLSIFDVVLLLLLVRQIIQRGVEWNARMLWPIATVLVLVVTACAAYYFGETLELAGLLRETIKYIGFVVGVTTCGLLFRGGSFASPSIPTLIALGFISLVMWLSQAFFFVSPEKTSLTVNSYSNACLALSIFAMYLLRDRMTQSIWIGIVLYQALVLIGCILVHATAMSMTTALVLMVTGTMAMAAGVHRPSIVLCTVALAVLAVAIGALMLCFAGGYDAFRSYDLGGGAVIRLALWQEAVRLVWGNFPFGIGPGQFGELGYTEYNLSFSLNSDVLRWLGVDLSGPIFGALPMRFVHNTILAMLVDWGIVALLLMALLFTLIWRVIRMPPSAAAICYCLYLLPTLLLHDGLGFRAHYLILGLAIGSFLVPRKEVGDFSD